VALRFCRTVKVSTRGSGGVARDIAEVGGDIFAGLGYGGVVDEIQGGMVLVDEMRGVWW
jgi:hypothetical protein